MSSNESSLVPFDLEGSRIRVYTGEKGLYNLMLGSRKPEARRFKRWVTHEVLPAIHRTGRYAISGAVAALPAAQQERVSALLLIGAAAARVPVVRAQIAMAATLTCIQEITGLATETLRQALPPMEEPICSPNSTGLEQLLDMKAKITNEHLAACGLQVRNQRGEWELTDAGRRWGEALPYCRQEQSGYQIMWNPAVVAVVRELG
jgi:hypothetical protein